MDTQTLANLLLALTVGAALLFYWRTRRALRQLIAKREANPRVADDPKR